MPGRVGHFVGKVIGFGGWPGARASARAGLVQGARLSPAAGTNAVGGGVLPRVEGLVK
jgi:hypothetical protein